MSNLEKLYFQREIGQNNNQEKDLNSSIDGVGDSSRLYLPCAKANRRNSCASIENKGFSHPRTGRKNREWRKWLWKKVINEGMGRVLVVVLLNIY